MTFLNQKYEENAGMEKASESRIL